MRGYKLISVVAALGFIAAMPARALIIDDFSSPAGGQSLSSSDNTDQNTSASASVLGSERDLRQFSISGTGLAAQAEAFVNVSPYTNILAVNNDSGVDSTVEVVWDGPDANATTVDIDGLGVDGSGQDLTSDGATGFLIDVLSIDTSISLTFTVWSDGGANSASVSQFVPAPNNDIYFAFALFTGVDFSDVSAIRLTLNGPQDWDGQLDLIQTTTETPVPAPLALLGAGLVGMGWIRSKKRKA